MKIPAVPREFRAAWVATVANIDWPSKPGLSTEDQQAEIMEILKTSEEFNLNALVLQVRAQCDAFYPSELEPWSYYLTGEQGKAPEPFYDPLALWVEEAHKRGIELHVWFNPYRAHHTATKGELSDLHLIKSNPGMARELKNGMWWLDPAQKIVQDHSMAVIMDVVRRYDIDGVHMDDYFYPYPSYNSGEDFPDEDTWQTYLDDGGKLNRGDWRRKAVDDFVERMYDEIKAEKPEAKVGLSPFGIYRPGHPASIKGFDQYEKLYADAYKWYEEGWVDYLTPQLYWPTNQIPQSFAVLLGWWSQNNVAKRHLWPGMGTYRIKPDNTGPTTVDEIFSEIMITRGITPEAPGQVHFSFKHFLKNVSGIKDALADGPYKEKALVPASPWLGNEGPEKPEVSSKMVEDNLEITWAPVGEKEVFHFVVSYLQGDNWTNKILTADQLSFSIQTKGTVKVTKTSNQGLDVVETEQDVQPITMIAVSAVDRLGNESDKAIVSLVD